MGKMHIGRKDISLVSENKNSEQIILNTSDVFNSTPSTFIAPISEKEIHIEYVDRIVEKPVEVIVEKEVVKEIIIEKEVPKMMIEYKTVEVPVMYETIKEVPIYIDREIIKEVTPKVIDISSHLEIKKKNKTIKQLKIGLFCSIILSLIIMVVK